ncbi:hypothetical protein LUW74_27530 [Actinomadura madurae]|uniref:hypothetical protein n=1 Tax=Actinomadura madurae TaxID=1993 RepID=UPI002026CF66|nr:hypothetical protein [Actinomadura madurae]URN06699.1 hypothetical protein LUW74_27530 [Actinomadura madurae]
MPRRRRPPGPASSVRCSGSPCPAGANRSAWASAGRRSARRWDGVLAVLPLDAARSLIDPFPRRLQEALAPAAPSLRGKGVRLRLRVALRIGLVDDERPDAPGILVELLLPEWRRLLPRLQVGLRRAAGG